MTSLMTLTLSAELRLSHCGNNGAVTTKLCGAVVKPGSGNCSLGSARLKAVFHALALTVHFDDGNVVVYAPPGTALNVRSLWAALRQDRLWRLWECADRRVPPAALPRIALGTLSPVRISKVSRGHVGSFSTGSDHQVTGRRWSACRDSLTSWNGFGPAKYLFSRSDGWLLRTTTA